MDECEALCDTLGIMVNGQLQCIGKIPDLKKKYGEGYCLIIKLKISNQIDEEFKAFDKFIQENILNSTLEGKILLFSFLNSQQLKRSTLKKKTNKTKRYFIK